jgi:thiol:disulfide interchange protein DsbC
MHQSRSLLFGLCAAAVAAVALAIAPRAFAAGPPGPQTKPPTAQLQRLVPKTTIGSPEPTAINGIFRVKVGSAYVYLTADGRHAFTGDLLDLATGENLTEQQRNKDHLAPLAGFPRSDLLIYPADGTEKARIHVFTDSSCPYCRKLQGRSPHCARRG